MTERCAVGKQTLSFWLHYTTQAPGFRPRCCKSIISHPHFPSFLHSVFEKIIILMWVLMWPFRIKSTPFVVIALLYCLPRCLEICWLSEKHFVSWCPSASKVCFSYSDHLGFGAVCHSNHLCRIKKKKKNPNRKPWLKIAIIIVCHICRDLVSECKSDETDTEIFKNRYNVLQILKQIKISSCI